MIRPERIIRATVAIFCVKVTGKLVGSRPMTLGRRLSMSATVQCDRAATSRVDNKLIRKA